MTTHRADSAARAVDATVRLALVADGIEGAEALAAELRRRGLVVSICAGATAPAEAATLAADAVLVDLAFARSDGWLAGLRRAAPAARPIVACTAEQIDVALALLEGAGDVVRKPLHAAEVAARLRRPAAGDAAGGGFRLIADRLHALICYVDRDRVVRYVNRTGASWWQVDPVAATGRTVAQLTGPHYAGIEEPLGQALAGETVQIDRVVAHPDGVRRTMLLTMVPDRDAAGTVCGVLAVSEDLTPAATALAELRRRNELIESVLAHIAQGLCAFGPTQELELWNDKAASLRGYPTEFLHQGRPYRDLLGFNFDEGLFGDGSREAFLDQMLQPAALREPFRVQQTVRSGTVLDIRRSPLPNGGFVLTYTDITESKRNEAVLRESERRFRAIVQNSPVPSAILRLEDGKPLFRNPEAERQVACLPTRGSGRDSSGLTSIWAAAIAALGDGAGFRDREVALTAADGSEIWLLCAGARITYGETPCLFVQWFDITETRRSRAALEISEATLAEAQRIAQVGSWQHDLMRDEVIWSANYFALLGLPPTAPPGYATILKLLHPADLRDYDADFLAAMRSGDGGQREYRIVRPDGAVRTMRTIFRIERDATGTATRVAGTTQDITDLRAAQAALAESEARFRAVIDQSPMSFVLTDVAGRLQLVNQTYEDWYGRPASAVIGKRRVDLMPAPTAQRLDDLDAAILADGAAREIELTLTRAGGPPQTLLLSAFPIRDADGAIYGIGHLGVDLTAQRAAEARLRQSQKMEVVGQMTGGVAHDFNNLLTAVIGNLDLLRLRLAHDREAVPLIDTAVRAAERGGRLTQQLLAFSRKQVLDPVVTDLNEVVRSFLPLARTSLRGTYRVETRLADDLPQVLVDRAQLDSALLNLVLNARDAMPDGGAVTISSGCRRPGAGLIGAADEVAGGEYVMIAVHDTGRGMSTRTRAHAVEPFFTTKPVGQGSGLGLSMAFGFVKQSGGHLAIDSAPGKGTTVRLFLPATDTAAGAGSGEPAPAARAAPRGSEIILVVEDDPDVRRFVSTVLGGLGYGVLQAKDGGTARRLMAAHRLIDLLLTDVMLPGGDSVAAEFRALFPAGRVLFTSGHSADALDGTEGDAAMLHKPYRVDTLATRVREVLDSR